MYFLNVVHLIDSENYNSTCCGYMSSLKNVMQVIQNEPLMLRELGNHVVIEHLVEGSFVDSDNQWWYSWNDDTGWIGDEKPIELCDINNFATGDLK